MDVILYRNADGTPVHGATHSGSDILWAIKKFVIPEDTDAGTIFGVFEVPSNFVLVGGALENDAAPTAGAVSLGLYETEKESFEEIDDDMFIQTQAVTGAATTSVLGEIALANREKTLWELSELVADREDTSALRQAYTVGLKVTTKVEGGDSLCFLTMKLLRKS